MKTLRLMCTLIILTVVAGCNNDTSTDTTSPPSKVEYTYTGKVNGSFIVNGAYPSQKDGSGAKSTLSSDRRVITISALDWTKSGSEANFIDITLTSDSAVEDNQVFTIGDPHSTLVCISGYGLDHSSFVAGDAYTGTIGTLTLTTVKDNQIKATFDMTAKNAANDGISITAGKVDVKY